MSMTAIEKRIYEYDNFREFLRDYYLNAKAKDKKFSFRFFARNAGFVSPSSLKRVIDGERNLTLDGIAKFSKALKLNQEESDFFKKLVLFNQSQTSEERTKLGREITQSRGYKRLRPLSTAQYNTLGLWYSLPIRELPNLSDFQASAEWVSKRLTPNITKSEAETALKELVQLGLLEKSNDTLKQTNADITTGDEVISSAAIQFHKDSLNLAAKSIDEVARVERDISAMTVGVSRQSMTKLKEMIQIFRKEIVEVLAREEGKSEGVYQLNIQFFPVARLPDRGEKP
jgi:uncharacterized protein (TIGR02147 family)